jgi:hypothetical protein
MRIFVLILSRMIFFIFYTLRRNPAKLCSIFSYLCYASPAIFVHGLQTFSPFFFDFPTKTVVFLRCFSVYFRFRKPAASLDQSVYGLFCVGYASISAVEGQTAAYKSNLTASSFRKTASVLNCIQIGAVVCNCAQSHPLIARLHFHVNSWKRSYCPWTEVVS